LTWRITTKVTTPKLAKKETSTLHQKQNPETKTESKEETQIRKSSTKESSE